MPTENLQKLFNTLDPECLILDQGGTVVFSHSSLSKFFWKKPPKTNEHVLDQIVPDLKPYLAEALSSDQRRVLAQVGQKPVEISIEDLETTASVLKKLTLRRLSSGESLFSKRKITETFNLLEQQIKETRENLQQKLIQKEAILDQLNEAVVQIDKNYNVTYANKAVEDFLGLDRQWLLSQHIDEKLKIYSHKGADEEPKSVDLIDILRKVEKNQTIYAPKDNFFSANIENTRKNLFELTVIPAKNSDGVFSGWIVNFDDVTQRQAFMDKVIWNSRHDSLTNLINRSEIESLIETAIEKARVDAIPSTVLYLDLDQFKVINDTCGHVAGDQLLKDLSPQMAEVIRDRDSLARIGGDEFIVLLNRCQVDNALLVAQKLLSAISNFTFTWEERVFKVGVSIGLVQIDENTENVSAVLSDADAACYEAKEDGRGCIRASQKIDINLNNQRTDMSTVAQVMNALENRLFEPYFQKVVPNQSEEDVFWEALVRIRDEKGQLLTPSTFLSASERFSMIKPIDNQMLKSVTQFVAENFSKNSAPRIAINVSAFSVVDNKYLDLVVKQFEKTGVDPAKFVFELTETAAMSDIVKAKYFVEQIQKLGSEVALDDFGTGTSSLAYLKELPVNYLKLDKRFVEFVGTDDINHNIIEATLYIASKLGTKVVAEGVETPTQANSVSELGIHFSQGYHFGRPIDKHAFIQQLS